MKKNTLEKGSLLEKWKQGNVRVAVYDGWISGKTSDELKKTNAGIENACWNIVNYERAKGVKI